MEFIIIESMLKQIKYEAICNRDMKISELCSMIQESIQAGRYPLENENQKKYVKFVKIINRSDSEDLKSNDIRIEVRIQDLFTLNNYVPNIEHLPGIIEMDILDSYKMLSRRAERVSSDLITNI
jgi:hypothetical protein